MDSCRVKETAHRFGLIEFVVWLVSVPPFSTPICVSIMVCSILR